MLVLSRKQNEEILIGEETTIRILSVEGGLVKLGISAPRSVRIVRAEVNAPDGPGVSDRVELVPSLV